MSEVTNTASMGSQFTDMAGSCWQGFKNLGSQGYEVGGNVLSKGWEIGGNVLSKGWEIGGEAVSWGGRQLVWLKEAIPQWASKAGEVAGPYWASAKDMTANFISNAGTFLSTHGNNGVAFLSRNVGELQKIVTANPGAMGVFAVGAAVVGAISMLLLQSCCCGSGEGIVNPNPNPNQPYNPNQPNPQPQPQPINPQPNNQTF